MTYQEMLENARKNLGPYCKGCAECNGRACKNQIPGPGSKGVGDTAMRNYDKWRDVRVNMDTLVEKWRGEDVPSRAFAQGGIHEAIMDYEDTVFFEILAEELARRDMDYQPVSRENYDELVSRMDDYIAEFEVNGTDNLVLSTDEA